MAVAAPPKTPAKKNRRAIVTPEGVRLPVALADRGERLAAVLIDLLIITGAFVALVLVLFGLITLIARQEFSSYWGSLSVALTMVAGFLLRSFYFLVFELRWQGQTPGKKVLGLRVVDRHGGPLRPEALFARNLMREIELFMPISLIFQISRLGIDGWMALLALVWTGIFVCLPLFNRDRMRAGDFIAGTWVVTTPKHVLEADLTASAAGGGPARPLTAGQPEAASTGATPPEGRTRFSHAQLDVYGIYELQMLEELLRKNRPDSAQAMAAVCERICKKIGWPGGPPADTRAFLEDYYAALRAHLESRMLFGDRRASKHDAPGKK